MASATMRWIAELRDVALLAGLSTGLGLAAIAAHDLPLLAPPPEPTELSCGGDEQLAASADPDAGPRLPRMSVGEVAEHLGRPGVTVVDARAGDSFLDGHIPGALHLPAWGAEQVLAVESVPIPPEDLVIVYCDGQAAELSDYLGVLLQAQVGCGQVRVIEGGWNAWLAAGAPVEGDLRSG